MSRFIIACGGTGGHLAPGIALAEELIDRGHICKLLISRKQVDLRLIQQYSKLDYMKIPGVGFSLKPIQLIKFLFEQTQAFLMSLQLLRKQKPVAVISFGGFTSLGIVVAAVLKRIPVILHEANRVPGKATTLFSSVAKRVYLPVEVESDEKLTERVRYVGFPLRKSIQRMDKKNACEALGLNANRKRLLVLGGSQGSSALNKWVLNHFEKLGALGVDVYCVTGLGKMAEEKIEYKNGSDSRAEAIFTDFIDNVSEVLCSADLVLSRAGAGSIRELIRCARPNVLVPFPAAADNHQLANARFLEAQGGAVVVEEKNLETLYNVITDTLFNDGLLNKFSQTLDILDKENSASKIADDLESLCKIK